MDTNCKNNNNKFNLDHVYCHSNESNYIRSVKSNESNYIRAAKSTGATPTDIMAILKENKQLKAMLLLHFDLIQEQSDQLMAKDKLLCTLREENASLRSKIDKLESGTSTSNSSSIRSNATKNIHSKGQKTLTGLSDSNKKIHKNSSASHHKHEAKKENLSEFSNENHKVNKSNGDKLNVTSTITTRSRQTPTPPTNDQMNNDNKYKIFDENSNTGSNLTSIIGQSNGKPISKIMLQLHRVKLPENLANLKKRDLIDDARSPGSSDSEINTFSQQLASIFDHKQKSPKTSLSPPPLISPPSRSPRLFRKIASPTSTSTVSGTKRIKSFKTCNKFENKTSSISEYEFKEEVEIKTEDTTEDGFSCGSSGPDLDSHQKWLRGKKQISSEIIGNSSATTSTLTNDPVIQTSLLSNNSFDNINSNFLQSSNVPSNLTTTTSGNSSSRKISFLTTRNLYSAREWICEEIPPEEFCSVKEEEEALKAEEPMLEIPKWTIKEISGLYSIEGTEDLSDDTFRKRHAKLEHDEKRRKKWDVQRIREQRTIERLKRRHCKDELIETDNQELTSFYPTSDQIKFIQISEDLPVEAFGGELIPRISIGEFQLPWKKQMNTINSEEITLQHHSDFGITNSNSSYIPTTTSFMFLKKRRRQQSTNVKRPLKGNLNTTNMSVLSTPSTNVIQVASNPQNAVIISTNTVTELPVIENMEI